MIWFLGHVRLWDLRNTKNQITETPVSEDFCALRPHGTCIPPPFCPPPPPPIKVLVLVLVLCWCWVKHISNLDLFCLQAGFGVGTHAAH